MLLPITLLHLTLSNIFQVSRPSTHFSIQFTAPNTSWENANPQFPEMTDENSRFKHELEVPQDVINSQRVTVTAAGIKLKVQ